VIPIGDWRFTKRRPRLLLPCWRCGANLLVWSYTNSHFFTDKGGEFEKLSAYVKSHDKTAAYLPGANEKVERRHKEISVLCRLYDYNPTAVAEMWHIGSYGVFQVKALPEAG